MARTADRFWAELRALYEAADQPTLKRLVRLGLEQHPPIPISDSTINGWLNRKAVPTGRKNERYLTAMVAYLQGRVGSRSAYHAPPAGEWARLLRASQLAEAYRVIGELTARVGRLPARVEQLERQAGRDSSTSSRPPSSDSPYKKGRDRSLRERGKRLPGKQPGEPGPTMKLVDDPDERFWYPPAACRGCGTCLDDAGAGGATASGH
ncbi:MAG TPA: DUF6444 domain-containing protein [Trebonia sp.]|nr:DUF6444 domain-containing protein [Trebonia sp.]